MERRLNIADELKARRPVAPVTVRIFLSWFDAQRRGYYIVGRIRRQLEEAGVITYPDFEAAWIDTPIPFLLAGSEQASARGDAEIDLSTSTARPIDEFSGSDPDATGWIRRDPTYRVSKAANQIIVSVKPDSTIGHAVTLMLANGFSQLPVMATDRDIKGTITWKSIGSRMALGTPAGQARDFMEPHHEISSDTSIFSAIPLIVANAIPG